MSELSLKRITKSYGSKVIIPGLDLDVPNGAFVALLGPSGCGKTTLLRMVAGLETPSSGEIRIGAQTVYAPGVNIPPEKRGLGMVFQSYAVWPHMTVWENVAYPLKIRGKKDDAAVEEALALVRLSDLRERYPHQLSGGQQQRVALARGLVLHPPVLLLDEPLSNLDAKLRAEARREIRDLHRSTKMTILYVTHDQREAFEMSTQVVVLNEGRIAQSGPPEEVRRAPSPGFVQEFLAEG
ncbi:MAG: ABC transporter ATP-binding protein [Bdellovibrionota bacterium]